uniref:Uncharacterized protein n=1 Tax=Ixodes ricinus TaxID=34613 RepID=A0A6B0URY8_IXORI
MLGGLKITSAFFFIFFVVGKHTFFFQDHFPFVILEKHWLLFLALSFAFGSSSIVDPLEEYSVLVVNLGILALERTEGLQKFFLNVWSKFLGIFIFRFRRTRRAIQRCTIPILVLQFLKFFLLPPFVVVFSVIFV